MGNRCLEKISWIYYHTHAASIQEAPIIEKVNNIDISLDGADEESCSVIRGKGVFDRVVNNIDILKQKGFENISLSMVLSNNNLRYAQQFFELNRKLHTFPMLRALS